jgi:hypothetical protein
MNTNAHESAKKQIVRTRCSLLFSYACSCVFIGGLFLVSMLSVGGCILSKPSLTPMATNVDVKQALPDYWWTQPGVATASYSDFEKLWGACKAELYGRLFIVDREEYREGLLTSEPLISKQIFEPWRSDAVTLHDQVESSLATLRRTVHFEVTRQPDGTYQVTPKVLIERFASEEHRLTAITQYHQAFSGPRVTDVTADQGSHLATDYWYPLRRDTDLEKVMADSIQQHVGK